MLEELDLTGCSQLDPQNVEQSVNAARHISILKLRAVSRLRNGNVQKIVETVGSSLRHLNLSDCVELNDFAVESVAANCPNLIELHLVDCLKVSGVAVDSVYQSCPKLATLDVSFCCRYSPGNGTSLTFNNLPLTITELVLNGVQVNCSPEHFIAMMIRLPQLEHLGLNGFNLLSDELLRRLLPNIGTQLKVLDLSGSFAQITDDSLQSIGEFCSVLEDLGVSLIETLTGTGLLPIFNDPCRAERLVSLRIANCTGFSYTVLEAICSNCKSLEVIEASGVYLFDDHLVSLLAENCPSLTRVFLKGSRSVTDESICELAARCPLRAICLSGIRRITDKSVFAIANHCHHLQELYLRFGH